MAMSIPKTVLQSMMKDGAKVCGLGRLVVKIYEKSYIVSSIYFIRNSSKVNNVKACFEDIS